MNNIKVLLAEDENGIAEILMAYLAKEGFNVVRAREGKEALSLFYGNHPIFNGR
ncbi:response regulator [Klebsiella quasipneumoniae]|uniref:hypothetical protein n=1 Tax=Klebsiella quasipneumoniae TaxID=1463165 RepID=UPI001C851509|nr:hypothetical protein [Klebsiella quasipneumoniae]